MDVMNSDLSWHLLHSLDDVELQFTLQVVINMAPTPDNLQHWGSAVIGPTCSVCGRSSTLCHILIACSVALE